MQLLYDGEFFSIDDVLRVLLAEKDMGILQVAREAGLYEDNVKKWFQKREKARIGLLGISRMMNAMGCDIHDIDRVVLEMRKKKHEHEANKTTSTGKRPAGTHRSRVG